LGISDALVGGPFHFCGNENVYRLEVSDNEKAQNMMVEERLTDYGNGGRLLYFWEIRDGGPIISGKVLPRPVTL
jgi:hypothetical protein